MRQTAPAKPSIQSPKFVHGFVQPLLAAGAAAALAACSQTPGAHKSAAHMQPLSVASAQPAHGTLAPASKPHSSAARTPAPAKVASKPAAKSAAAPVAKPAGPGPATEGTKPAAGDAPAKAASTAPKDAGTEKMKESVRAAIKSQHATRGIASYYKHGTLTASGEKFDTNEFTAAHRTLPFGTRLRVTNLATGRSVLVRVNDRGPFIDGRVVDLTYAAAESLGFTPHGLAPVKLDVLR